MKIKKIYWDNFRGYLRIYMDNSRYLIIIFKRDTFRRHWNKYLTIRNVISINGRWLPDIDCPYSNYLPIRDLQRFIRKLVRLYEGDIDGLAREWFDEEKKTTKV